MSCPIAEPVDDLELSAFLRVAARRARSALVKYGLRDPDLEDCAQEVLIALFKRWTLLSSYALSARYGYLNTVCRGAASDWRRHARYTPQLLPHGEADCAPDSRQSRSAEREYFGMRVRAAIRAELADCSPGVRATFVLVHLAGHTEAETASLQGVPLGTVASRLRRMRIRLREVLSQRSAARGGGVRPTQKKRGSIFEARTIL